MRVYVYAISKNEAQFARRWAESMAEADGIYVLDTGSDDGTPEALEALGVQVTRARIEPWRFDYARNASLELVPLDADICVCTDLDEVFRPGWRRILEENWAEGTTRARYEYVWSFDDAGRDATVFFGEKIHSRAGHIWQGAVHEVLKFTGAAQKFVTIPAIRLEHHPDPAKSRGQYLPLLELAVAEDPENDRNMHYLGREYFFHGRWRECIATLKRHLALKSAVWPAERAASMEYIARSCLALGRPLEAERWAMYACAEAPEAREGWLLLASLCLEREKYAAAYAAAERALEIKTREKHYITRGECWGSLPHDIAAISAWHLGLDEEAVRHGKMALEAQPENERLRENLKFYTM